MPALDHLAGLFYSDPAELGTFAEVLVESVPEPYRALLAHHDHMTVSVEKHHGSPVDVEAPKVLLAEIPNGRRREPFVCADVVEAVDQEATRSARGIQNCVSR